MALSKTYKKGFNTSVNAVALENIRITMPVDGKPLSTPPSLQGYAFKTGGQYASFLANEGQQILSGLEFDFTDASKPFHYDYLQLLAKCGGNVSAEYNPDGSVKDEAALQKGKAARQHAIHGHFVGGTPAEVSHKASRVENGKAIEIQDKADGFANEVMREGIADELFRNAERAFAHPQGKPIAADFTKAKEQFAQYAAVAQEEQDLDAVSRAFEVIKKRFEKSGSHDYAEMQDFTGIAYMAANGILQATTDSFIQRNKVKLPHEIVGLPEGEREEAAATYQQTRKVVYESMQDSLNTEKLQGNDDDNRRDLDAGRRAMRYLNDLSALGVDYSHKNQGPEVDGALQLQTGYSIFTDTGEKIIQSNLDNGISLILTNLRPVKNADGETLAPGQAIAASIQTAETAGQIPQLFASFLKKHPGMEDKDIGVYIVGGRGNTQRVDDYNADPSQRKPGDLVVMDALFDHLKSHPSSIEGSCLFHDSQPLSFACSGGQGGIEFTPGRAKTLRENTLAIDFAGSHNLHDGVANIIAAPGQAASEPMPYVAASRLKVGFDLGTLASQHPYVEIQMASPDALVRDAPVLHAHEKQFGELFNQALDSVYSRGVTEYIFGETGMRANPKCWKDVAREMGITDPDHAANVRMGNRLKEKYTPVANEMLQNKFGFYIGEPPVPADAKNPPLKGGINAPVIKALKEAVNYSDGTGRDSKGNKIPQGFNISQSRWDEIEKANNRVRSFGMKNSTLDEGLAHKAAKRKKEKPVTARA